MRRKGAKNKEFLNKKPTERMNIHHYPTVIKEKNQDTHRQI